MKRILMMVAIVATFAMTAMAQTPWKIVDMEMVTKHGGNCEYDDETCTATFTGSSDRWFDLPEVSGDLSGHTKMTMNILNSTCMLRIHIRYKDEDGKVKQTEGQTFYRQMGSTIEKPKLLKFDLTDGGKVSEDVLKNVVAIRVAMAKAVDGNEEPWTTQFGEVTIQ